MIRRPPRSPLFPYPPLFRSELPSALPVLKNLSPKYLRQNAVCPVSVEGGLLTVATADPLNPIIVDDLRQSTGLNIKIVVCPADRKSTRLNSSHDQISYAVFC